MSRAFILPMIGTGTPKVDPRRPKYLADLGILDWCAMDYGLEPVALVVCNPLDATQAALSANADVYTFPLAFDATLGGQEANALKAAFATVNIPETWIGANNTSREVIRVTAQLFQFAKRLHARGATRLFPAGVTLSTQWNALPLAFQNALLDCAQSFGWSTAGFSGTSTMRNMLRAIVDQWGNTPILLGGETF